MGFLIDSDANNQKILFNGSSSISIGSPNFSGTYTYNHNLGYIPAVGVWYEPLPGQWMPLSVRQYNNGATFQYYEITGEYYLTSTNIVVSLRNAGNANSCNIWVRVYLDD